MSLMSSGMSNTSVELSLVDGHYLDDNPDDSSEEMEDVQNKALDLPRPK